MVRMSASSGTFRKTLRPGDLGERGILRPADLHLALEGNSAFDLDRVHLDSYGLRATT